VSEGYRHGNDTATPDHGSCHCPTVRLIPVIIGSHLQALSLVSRSSTDTLPLAQLFVFIYITRSATPWLHSRALSLAGTERAVDLSVRLTSDCAKVDLPAVPTPVTGYLTASPKVPFCTFAATDSTTHQAQLIGRLAKLSSEGC
jgi:hypothetical protein